MSKVSTIDDRLHISSLIDMMKIIQVADHDDDQVIQVADCDDDQVIQVADCDDDDPG